MKIKKKKILIVFGTRPEAIKMAPLIIRFQESESFTTLVCVTAQHREMLDQVLEIFSIKPDYDLNVMQTGQDLYDLTARILIGMRKILKEADPDIVLVHGDTTTSFATSLAAFYQQIPVAHVEAGLRTHQIYSPWPEEINRQLTSRIANYHFAPTLLSKQNLIEEGVKEDRIFVTGNTVIDSLYEIVEKIKTSNYLKSQIVEHLNSDHIQLNLIESWAKSDRKLILITGHRRENFGKGFINICKAIKELAIKYPEADFVYPMHLNPNVKNAVQEVFGLIKHKKKPKINNVYFIAPLDYIPFVYLMNLSYLILTDSGGIQEEAPALGKPVLVMRDTTERPEAVNAGTVRLVGTSTDMIIAEVSSLIDNENVYKAMAKANNPYGDGKASSRIVEVFK